MTVTVYRSDDVGAPTLTAEEGDLITLLDAVLINGYDVKPAAGWTKPFSGTNQAVYRNSTANGGTGTFFQVDDSKALSGAAYKRNARVRGGVNCTGFDALTDEFGADSNFISKCVDSDANATYVQPWVIVADEHTFMVFGNAVASVNSVAITGTTVFSGAMVGDYRGILAGQATTSLIGGAQASGTYHSALSYIYYFNTPFNQAGVAAGAVGNQKTIAGNLNVAYNPPNAGSKRDNLYRGKHTVQGCNIAEESNYNKTLGVLRGLNYVTNNDTTGFQTGDTFTEGGKSFLLLNLYTLDAVWVAIETTDWVAV